MDKPEVLSTQQDTTNGEDMNKPLLTMRGGHMMQGLHDLIAYTGIKDSTVVEIGTFAGESTQVFAQYAALVYTIDPWVEYEEGTYYGLDVAAARSVFFATVMADDHDNKIKSLQITSEQAVQLFNPYSVPHLYVDGWHKYAMEDVDRWWDTIAMDGWMTGHDYNEERFPHIPLGLSERFGMPDAIFQDESWAVQKTAERDHQWRDRRR